ncbi:hypothetical protein GCM10020218_041700 [Dactylosporangium vinaceum]
MLPEHSELLEQLPNPIDREAVRAQASSLKDEADAIRLFITAMVWGYGPIGYGPFRTARVLAENSAAAATLLSVGQCVRTAGGPAAFGLLKKNRLRWLGVSFATKYMYFCNEPSRNPALILDSLVQRWLSVNADIRLRTDWRVDHYERYVRTVVHWAAQLSLELGEVEFLMFDDELHRGNDNTTRRADLRGFTIEPSTGAECQAVLDALDEAVDAFAAMMDGAEGHDHEDFDRGIRQLRRIVVARAAQAGSPC